MISTKSNTSIGYNMNIKILGIAGGNGVILYPFKKWLIANYEPRPAFKTPDDIQWHLNFNSIPLLKDHEALSAMFGNRNNPDVIIGAPDCGHSSMFALSRIKHFRDPKENVSLTFFLESITLYEPKVWLMENLPKLIETYSKNDFEKLFPKYHIFTIMESVSKFGNSQKTRIRLVVVGILKDLISHDKVQKLIKPFSIRERLKLSGELIKGLEKDINGHITENINKVITVYAGYKLDLRTVKHLWSTALKDQCRWPVDEPRAFSNAPGVYKNPADRYPMTARRQNRQFNHYGLMMSPRELARIQGIPDRFKIWVDDKRKEFCINKGRTTVSKTPPIEIALWFRKVLIKLHRHDII